jgi:hypothetical protein
MTSSIESSPIAPPGGPAAPPTKSAFQRIAGVLFNPVETFADIARRPDILIPLIVVVVISILSSIVVMPRVDFESAIRDSMADQKGEMSSEDRERVVRFGTAAAKAVGYAAPLLNVVFFAVIAAILLLVFRLLGGEGNYKQAFSVTVYSWFPLLIQGILGLIILLAKGSVPAEQLPNLVMSNLGFLVDMKQNPVAFALLSALDIFTIWTLALFIIGFSFVARVSRAKSAAVVLSLWVILLLFKVGAAAMGAMAKARR